MTEVVGNTQLVLKCLLPYFWSEQFHSVVSSGFFVLGFMNLTESSPTEGGKELKCGSGKHAAASHFPNSLLMERVSDRGWEDTGAVKGTCTNMSSTFLLCREWY